jgi:putative intracellular protease/amidase
MARVLFLLPALDFDPSEAAVSWQVLVNAGHVVRFATPDGRPAVADDMMLTGRGLDLWGQIPLLRNLPLLGLLMRANRNARQAYAKMIVDPNYVAPQRWDAIDPMAFDALLLPGGHRARGMRNYLESDILQRLVAHFSMKRNRWRQSVTACSWRRAVSRSGRGARFSTATGRPL